VRHCNDLDDFSEACNIRQNCLKKNMDPNLSEETKSKIGININILNFIRERQRSWGDIKKL